MTATQTRPRNNNSNRPHGASNTGGPRDISSVISRFNYLFREKTKHLLAGKTYQHPKRGTELHKLQVDYSWLLHKLTNAYPFDRPRVVSEVSNFINNIPSPNTPAEEAASA